MDPKIQELANLIKNSTYIVGFTGAGISTESGLPDFSGVDRDGELAQAPSFGAELQMPDFTLSNIRSGRPFSQCLGCTFKSRKIGP